MLLGVHYFLILNADDKREEEQKIKVLNIEKNLNTLEKK